MTGWRPGSGDASASPSSNPARRRIEWAWRFYVRSGEEIPADWGGYGRLRHTTFVYQEHKRSINRFCASCGRDLEEGPRWAGVDGFWTLCVDCGDAAPDVPPRARPRTTLTIEWDNELPGSEIRRLSTAWAATISEKPVVAQVHVTTSGTIEDTADHYLEVEAR